MYISKSSIWTVVEEIHELSSCYLAGSFEEDEVQQPRSMFRELTTLVEVCRRTDTTEEDQLAVQQLQEVPDDAAVMVAVGCKSCLMYIMLPKLHPSCPKCGNADVLLDLPSPTPKKQRRVLELSSTPKWNWLDAKPIATWSSLLDFPSYVSTQFLPSQFLSFFHDPTSSITPLFKLLPSLHFFSFIYNPTSSASFHDSPLHFFYDTPAWASFMIPFLQLLRWSHFFSFLHLSSSVAFLSQGQVLLQRLNCNGDCGQNQKERGSLKPGGWIPWFVFAL